MDAVDPVNHVDLADLLTDDVGAAQTPAVAAHLDTCAACRAEFESLRRTRAALRAAPPELLLDGRPEDADLLLERTVRRVRREARSPAWMGALAGAAAVVVVVVALAAGLLVGRTGRPGGQAPALPQAPVIDAAAPGTHVGTATDPGTGASAIVQVAPAMGWVRLRAFVRGIAAGERCQLIAVGRTGSRQIAGNWLVSADAAARGVDVEGSALVADTDLEAVLVQNEAGRTFVRVGF